MLLPPIFPALPPKKAALIQPRQKSESWSKISEELWFTKIPSAISSYFSLLPSLPPSLQSLVSSSRNFKTQDWLMQYNFKNVFFLKRYFHIEETWDHGDKIQVRKGICKRVCTFPWTATFLSAVFTCIAEIIQRKELFSWGKICTIKLLFI